MKEELEEIARDLVILEDELDTLDGTRGVAGNLRRIYRRLVELATEHETPTVTYTKSGDYYDFTIPGVRDAGLLVMDVTDGQRIAKYRINKAREACGLVFLDIKEIKFVEI